MAAAITKPGCERAVDPIAKLVACAILGILPALTSQAFISMLLSSTWAISQGQVTGVATFLLVFGMLWPVALSARLRKSGSWSLRRFVTMLILALACTYNLGLVWYLAILNWYL